MVIVLGRHYRVLDEIIRYYTEQADEANIAKYTDLKNQYTTIMADRDALLSSYGVTDKTALETQRDAIKVNMDALDLNDFIKVEEDAIDRDIDDGSVVYVEYDNGHWFILNYNNFVVDVEMDSRVITIQPKEFYDSKAGA